MNDLIIIIGAFGSGKSEYAVNIAHRSIPQPVALVDLDVVNPYFRSRDVRKAFGELGIDVICPEGDYAHADLPMISPRIRGAIQNNALRVVLDVGGDRAGSRALARFTDECIERGYDMRLVVNTRRPWTNDVAGIESMAASLEHVSGLRITRLVCNTHLMELTTPEIVEEGVDLVRKAAQALGLPFDDYLVMAPFANMIPDGIGGLRRVVLDHFLLKPWEHGILQNKGL